MICNEKEAFIADLFSGYYSRLRNMCLHKVKGRPELYDLADEAVQETFIVLHEKYHRLINHPNIAGWLYETCKYQLSNKIALHQRRERLHAYSIDDERSGYLQASDDEDTWSVRMEINELLSVLLGALTAKEKSLFFDHFILGLTIREIAEAKGIREAAARSVLKRLRNKARAVAKKNIS